ncbi:MAG: vitamin K epoxide reductase family protein [Candidatus Magasanikbacteria bacterium]|nr:vitamin K epoxide reductase family protein [Candidatus Magasanikbacteria bacterium]
MIISALFGFSDASYLSFKDYMGQIPSCSILKGCETVATSSYSHVLGLPVALLGALYYFLILILTIAYLDRKKENLLRYTAYFTWAGLLASLWFTYLQVFVIKAICLYCIGSALSSSLLFIFGQIILFYLPSKKNI